MPQLLLHTQSDERLALLASAGRPAAFAVLVERHRRSLYRVALGIVSIGEAEDVIQVTLLQAWAALQRGGEVRHVRGWLHQIARHVALRHRAQPVPVADIDEQTQQALAVTPDPDARLLMRETLAAIAQLPDNQREALLRCAVHGESQASVAGYLETTEPGCTPTAVPRSSGASQRRDGAPAVAGRRMGDSASRWGGGWRRGWRWHPQQPRHRRGHQGRRHRRRARRLECGRDRHRDPARPAGSRGCRLRKHRRAHGPSRRHAPWPPARRLALRRRHRPSASPATGPPAGLARQAA
jgi:RNA polymerase sigma factor (sigma-70 family)